MLTTKYNANIGIIYNKVFNTKQIFRDVLKNISVSLRASGEYLTSTFTMEDYEKNFWELSDPSGTKAACSMDSVFIGLTLANFNQS